MDPPPLLNGGYDLPKMEPLGGEGVRNFLLERGDKPVMGGGVDVEMWGLQLFYYFTVQSCLLCVRGK